MRGRVCGEYGLLSSGFRTVLDFNIESGEFRIYLLDFLNFVDSVDSYFRRSDRTNMFTFGNRNRVTLVNGFVGRECSLEYTAQ